VSTDPSAWEHNDAADLGAIGVELAVSAGALFEWHFDPPTGGLSWTGPAAQVLGVGLDTEQELRRLLAPILTVVQGGCSWDHYDLRQRLTGSDSSRELLVRARRMADGSTSGMVLDLSDQSRASDGFADVVERYRLLVELSPDMIVVHQQGVVRYMNPTGVKQLGFDSANDVIGRPVLDFIDPSSVPALMQRLRLLDAPGAVSAPTELTIVRKDGSKVVLESQAVHTVWAGQRAQQVFLRDNSVARKAEAALRHQASVLSSVSDAIVSIDDAGQVQTWNPAAERLYRIPAEEAIGQPLVAVIGLQAVDGLGHPRTGEREHRRADGTTVAVHVSLAPVLGANGYVAVCADLSERQQAAAARAAAEARFSAVVAALEEGIVLIENDGTASAENAAARAILGCDPGPNAILDALLTSHPVTTTGAPLLPEHHPVTLALRTGRGQRDFVVGFDHPSRERRWLSINCQVLEPAPGRDERSVVCSFSDITRRRDIESRLSYEATHDSLTGLVNRRRFVEHVETLLASPEAPPVAVVFVDLDAFKSVNDVHGHHCGDEVIRHIAARLTQAVGAAGLVCRLAGDEFVAATSGIDQPGVLALARTLQVAAGTPIALADTRTIVVNASVGIAFATRPSTSEELLRDADMAMYRAKQRGGGTIEVFNSALRTSILRRFDISHRLRDAIRDNLVVPHYQPVVSLQDGTVQAVEALARWRDPELGAIPPTEFIAIAEEHGLIIDLGSSILRQACLAAARWSFSGQAPIGLAVNLSARQLTDPSLVSLVRTVLAESKLNPTRLSLEVTESVLMDDVNANLEVLTQLREIGIHLAIDDFGTGYSSLAYLRRLPVDTLKIDRSFILGIGSPEDNAIVTAIVGLAHTLGRRVIAEGVETLEQLQFLRDIECDLAQGFLLGRPDAHCRPTLNVVLPAKSAELVDTGRSS